MLSIKRLSLAEAKILMDGARRKSEEIGVPMCIAVADDSGNTIAFDRMDGGKGVAYTHLTMTTSYSD